MGNSMYVDAKAHYDMLIDEGNDPVHDGEALKAYMDKWDGGQFIDDLRLSGDETVLEIGVGTGRLATKVCDRCKVFYGIDLSPKTIETAKKNLSRYKNIHLICDDFLRWASGTKFDVIYSSLTFLHIEDKVGAISKIHTLLNESGRFVLSIEKSQEHELICGERKVKTYPDRAEETKRLLCESGFAIVKQYETEFANIFVAVKRRQDA